MIYQSKLYKAWFHHDNTYDNLKNLPIEHLLIKCYDKACNIAENPKYDGY